MGITMGDALSVVSAFFALGLSLWATTTLMALMAPNKCRAAQERLAAAPYRSGFEGLLVGYLWAALGIVLVSQPVPLIKLVGLIALGTLSCTMLVGLAGMALLVADRVGRRDPTQPGYTVLAKATGLVVAATATPLVGWFFLGPIVLLVSVGAGFRALVGRRPAPAETVETPPVGGL